MYKRRILQNITAKTYTTHSGVIWTYVMDDTLQSIHYRSPMRPKSSCFPGIRIFFLQPSGRSPWTGDRPARKASTYPGYQRQRKNRVTGWCPKYDSNTLP